MTTFTPIENHSIIGNLETCALVGRDGTIDWYCAPHLESPSVFGKLLDTERGGYFGIQPVQPFEAEQQYLENTNVLQTTFRTAVGELTLTDFMPVIEREDGRRCERAIYRRITATSGTVDVEVDFQPRFDYARATATAEATAEGVVATGEDTQIALTSPIRLDVGSDGARGTTVLSAGETQWFVLQTGDQDERDATDCEDRLTATAEYWQDWAHSCDQSECVFGGPWHDLAVRAGLVLKLLTHRETGAICAAPTTSLPEEIGGVRNWDYRYNWIRDAAFTAQALANLGHTAEVRRYLDWFLDLCHVSEPAQIRPLYGLHGETDLNEQELDHLAGYRDSAPVRIGNDAVGQRQLDIYGDLVLAIDELVEQGGTLTEDDWDAIREIIEYVCEVWDEPDAGIWEVRDGPKQFVYSKVMCWVALDRGLALADTLGFETPFKRWRDTRETIKTTVIEEGFNEDLCSFMQSFDDDETLDAAGLLLPVVGFLPVDDPRVQGTVDAIRERLTTDEGLVQRYNGDDGLPGEEGAFVWCSFWLVDALALSGRHEQARTCFESLLEYVNDVGLLSEEVHPETGEQLGNFPQAFSHIGLINSALYLGRAAGKEQPGPEPLGVRLGRNITLSQR